MGRSYFVIVGRRDACLYDWVSHPASIPADGAAAAATASPADKAMQMRQFVAHAALDVVEHQTAQTTNVMHRHVDSHGDWKISAFVPYGPVKLLLLQEGDGALDAAPMNKFFLDAHELVARLVANPFTALDAPIASELFRSKMRAICQRHLGGGR